VLLDRVSGQSAEKKKSYLAACPEEALVLALDEEALQHAVLEADDVGLPNPRYLERAKEHDRH